MCKRGFVHRDLDGVGCYILIKSIYPNAEITFHGYEEINESILNFCNQDSNSEIIIADLSIKENTLLELNERGHVLLFDHHPDTEKLFNKYKFDWCIYKENMCGSKILFNHLYKNEDVDFYYLDMMNLISAINSWDLWLWKKENQIESLQLNRLLYLLGFNNFINRFLNDPSLDFTESEMRLLKLEQQKIDNYIKCCAVNASIIDITNEYTAVVIFAENYINEIAEYYKDTINDYDLVAVINMKSKSVSLRSLKENVDVEKIAKIYKGGGHLNASGFKIQNKEAIIQTLIGGNINDRNR